jgi:hypothetical protein
MLKAIPLPQRCMLRDQLVPPSPRACKSYPGLLRGSSLQNQKEAAQLSRSCFEPPSLQQLLTCPLHFRASASVAARAALAQVWLPPSPP